MTEQKQPRRPHLAGLVLARGGSQGIPLKNLAVLGSRPLLAWSLGAMTSFGGFTSLWVSTDHPGIATCAAANGANVFPRSAKFASDDAASVDAVKEFLLSRPEVDIVGLVQCTSPFLRPEFLDEAHRLMVDEGYDSVFSVCRQKKFRWSEQPQQQPRLGLRPQDDDDADEVGDVEGRLNPDQPEVVHSVKRQTTCLTTTTRPLNFRPRDRPRRQDWRGDLVENGMFYFARRSLVLDDGLLQGGKHVAYVETPVSLSLEIDTSLDLALAETIVQHEAVQPYTPEAEASEVV